MRGFNEFVARNFIAIVRGNWVTRFRRNASALRSALIVVLPKSVGCIAAAKRVGNDDLRYGRVVEISWGVIVVVSCAELGFCREVHVCAYLARNACEVPTNGTWFPSEFVADGSSK